MHDNRRRDRENVHNGSRSEWMNKKSNAEGWNTQNERIEFELLDFSIYTALLQPTSVSVCVCVRTTPKIDWYYVLWEK